MRKFEYKKDGEIKLAWNGSCPTCGNEQYASNVLSGICTWCGWDINKLEEYKRKESKV